MRVGYEDALRLHDALIACYGGVAGVRDKGLLLSALGAPFQEFAGVECYPGIYAKAARLCLGLIKNHAFTDGNKRTGMHLMLVFLELNDITLEITENDLCDFAISVAEGKVDIEAAVAWIKIHKVNY